MNGVQEYLLKEVQKVYRMQGVEIGDKHVEVMVRQMLRKIRVTDAGDTKVLPGALIEIQNALMMRTKMFLSTVITLRLDVQSYLVLPKRLLKQTHSYQLHPSKKQLVS